MICTLAFFADKLTHDVDVFIDDLFSHEILETFNWEMVDVILYN